MDCPAHLLPSPLPVAFRLFQLRRICSRVPLRRIYHFQRNAAGRIVSRRQATDINRRATANGPRPIVEGYGVIMRYLICGRTAPVGLTLRWPAVYCLYTVTVIGIIERAKLRTAWSILAPQPPLLVLEALAWLTRDQTSLFSVNVPSD